MVGGDQSGARRSKPGTMASPPEIETLVEAASSARLANDWQKSDELRRELNARGWEVRDTKDGQKITRRVGIKP